MADDAAHEAAVEAFLGLQDPRQVSKVARQHVVLSPSQLQRRRQREVPLAIGSEGQPVFCQACWRNPCTCWR